MSTALWMLKESPEKYNVTILEKCTTVPAPDAASTDINKIVRAGDYADPHLAKLSVDAVEHWRQPEWQGCYHESGVVCLSGDDPAGRAFVDASYANCKAMGLEPNYVRTPTEIKACWPKGLETGAFAGRAGYHNTVGGWGEAARSIEIGLQRVKDMGGKVRGGAEVVAINRTGRKVTGVTLKSGEQIPADLVVVAAGAWTPALMQSPEIDIRMPESEVIATGQCVAMVKLEGEELELHNKAPVVFNLDNGYYVFPPTKDGIVKMAIHGAGYTCSTGETCGDRKISLPRTKLTPGAENGALPVEAVKAMRQHLEDHYPYLARKPFVETRMCWYCDTKTGDWLVDYHPDFDNLVLATGGSGHAFKFVPIIGREVKSIIEGTATQEFKDRFAFTPGTDKGADVRNGVRKEICIGELCVPADLLPNNARVSRL